MEDSVQNLLHQAPSVRVNGRVCPSGGVLEHGSTEVKSHFGVCEGSLNAVDIFLCLIGGWRRRAIGHKTHVFKLGSHIDQVVERHALTKEHTVTTCRTADLV